MYVALRDGRGQAGMRQGMGRLLENLRGPTHFMFRSLDREF